MKNLENKPDSNREAIELYLVSDEGSVQLSDKQKELLQRWQYADELIRQQEIRKRETQAQMIMRKFGVTRTTAYQDIVSAEAVFASSTPLNKRYRIQCRIEFIEQKIDELYAGFIPEPEEGEEWLEKVYRIKQNKEYFMEACHLEKVLQKYYEAYPDIQPRRSPKKIVYNIQNNILPAAPMTRDEAINAARKMLHIKPREENGTSSE